MDIPQVLAVLRPNDDWGPCSQSDSTYSQLVAGWRGPSPVPTEQEMLHQWASIEAGRVAAEAVAKRTAAINALMVADDPISVAVRAFVRDIYTQINDIRVLHSLDRQLEQEIVVRVIGGIQTGSGDAPQVNGK